MKKIALIFLGLALILKGYLFATKLQSYRFVMKADDGTCFVSDTCGRMYTKLSMGLSRMYLYESLELIENRPVLINTFRDSSGNIYHSQRPIAVFFDFSGALWLKSIQSIQ
jgi:hypothetical protein